MFEPDATELNALISQNDLNEVLGDFSETINEPELGVEINPLGIFCQKTGYQIATRDKASLLQLIAICGKDNLSGNLYNATSLCVHPAWICTNPDDLDNLIDSDPVGYACFCFDILTKEFYKNNAPKPQDNRKLSWCEKYWSLARANALMCQRGAAEIAELNRALARLISFMPEANSYLFTMIGKFAKTPEALAELHCNGELVAILDTATNKTLDNIGCSRAYAREYIKKTMFIDIAATPEDAARGPSNVRRQKVSKEKIEDATMFAELIKMAKGSGIDISFQATNLPGSTAWQQRLKSKAEMRELDMLAQLSTLASFSNVALPEVEDEDLDDNEVEVRNIIIMPELPVQPIEPPVKLTGIALLRARKAGLL